MNYSIHTVEFRKYFEHWRDLKSFTDRMFLDAYKNYDMYRANKIIHIEIFKGLGIRVYIREEKVKAYIGFIISLNCVKGEYKAIDLIKPNEIDEAIDLANARIRLRFGPGFSLEEMSLCRVDLCVNIDVDSRENVSEYIKLLNKTHSSKAYKLSASPYYGVENEFKATGYNGSEISIYNKEAELSSRKNSEATNAEGILRIEYRIKRKGEINFMTCRYTDSNIGRIKYLANNSEKIIKSIMSKLVLNADYYKPSVLQQALEANVRTNILKRRIEIVAEYIDRAYSARSDQRPEFQQMIHDAKSGRFEVVLVHKLDRFSRDRYDSAHYRHELKKHGVAMRSVIENLDDSPESVILQSVIEGMNEYYSRNLARETMKGLKENAYSGKHTGGMPPLGYRVNPETTRIEIDEHEAMAVRLIFSMADSGAKYPAILAELKARGFRTKMGKHFTSTSIHDILVNEKYIGICVYNKRVSQSVANNSRRFKDKSEWIVREDVYPPLISREQFTGIQERMKRRKVSNQAHPKEVYLLSGKIHCGLCGRAYCGERKINGKGIVSYSYLCNSRNRTKDERCINPQVNRSYIESYV